MAVLDDSVDLIFFGQAKDIAYSFHVRRETGTGDFEVAVGDGFKLAREVSISFGDKIFKIQITRESMPLMGSVRPFLKE
jgi:hypothetical protein